MAELQVDISKMTLGDLEVLDNWSQGKARISDALSVFEKIMDTDPRQLPLTALGEIVEAITAAVTEAQDPKN